MVKPKKNIAEERHSSMDWPFKVDVRLKRSKVNRVAFMTTQSRSFLPEDTGYSRFGIFYAMNTAPGDVPNPNYFPSDDRLQKSISTRGYGIGGLTGTRFAKDVLANNPAPNTYQQYVPVPVPKRKSKRKKSSTAGSEAVSKKSTTLDIAPKLAPQTSVKLNKEQKRRLCLQKVVGFGTELSVNRFGKESSVCNVGVGYYDLRKKPAQLAKQGSFGHQPIKLMPPIVTRCNYNGHDKCFECDEVLRSVDYYRTWKKIKNPFYNVHPQDRIGTQDTDNIYLRDVDPTATISNNLQHVFVCLCRKCFCRAKRGESKFWDPKEVAGLFHKTRHCSYIHDHRNIPIFIHKTSCEFIRKLNMKEILMSKYYKDDCERVLKAK